MSLLDRIMGSPYGVPSDSRENMRRLALVQERDAQRDHERKYLPSPEGVQADLARRSQVLEAAHRAVAEVRTELAQLEADAAQAQAIADGARADVVALEQERAAALALERAAHRAGERSTVDLAALDAGLATLRRRADALEQVRAEKAALLPPVRAQLEQVDAREREQTFHLARAELMEVAAKAAPVFLNAVMPYVEALARAREPLYGTDLSDVGRREE